MQLTHIAGRVIVKLNLQEKNSHTFANGEKIVLQRDVNNYDQRYTRISQGIVISADNIPQGAEVLLHHHAAHETYRIYNYTQLSGKEIAGETFFYSIPEDMVYLWRVGHGQWKPFPGYSIGLRVYEPYTGILVGMKSKLIPNTLFITDGEYKGCTVATARSADYEIIFQGEEGRECRVIRLRSSDNEKKKRDSEVLAIRDDLTEKIRTKKLHIGLTPDSAEDAFAKLGKVFFNLDEEIFMTSNSFING